MSVKARNKCDDINKKRRIDYQGGFVIVIVIVIVTDGLSRVTLYKCNFSQVSTPLAL